MINKKICMIGPFLVGKTSLVDRYVHSVFSDNYLSTVGVKISKKAISTDGRDVALVLWDMEGKDDYADINVSYLRGAMGFFVVADGTRQETFEAGLALRERALDVLGPTPHCLLVNKADLAAQWEVTREMLDQAADSGVQIFLTSAKDGSGINEAFLFLAEKMLEVKK